MARMKTEQTISLIFEVKMIDDLLIAIQLLRGLLEIVSPSVGSISKQQVGC